MYSDDDVKKYVRNILTGGTNRGMTKIFQRASVTPGIGGVAGKGFVMRLERVTRAMRAGGGK